MVHVVHVKYWEILNTVYLILRVMRLQSLHVGSNVEANFLGWIVCHYKSYMYKFEWVLVELLEDLVSMLELALFEVNSLFSLGQSSKVNYDYLS